MSWPSGKVSDIGEVISGFAFKSEWFGVGNAKVIRIGDLQDGRVDLAGAETFDESAHQVREQFKIRNGDILMALSGATVGKIAVADTSIEGAYLNQRVAVVRGKCPTNTEYLKYVFSGNLLQKLLINAGGAAQPNLSPRDLGDMEIPLPPLEEQKRIAAILDKADAIRRKRQQAIKLADDFLRSVFLEMFGDPVTNPKGWEVKRLSEFTCITTGNTPSRAEPKYYGDYIEWIKSDNINTPSHFLTKATEYLSLDGYNVSRTVPAGSTLVTCIAGSFDCIGNAAYTDREVAFNQQINALTPKDGINSWFLYALILLSKKAIQAASTNSMKGMLSKGRMEAIELIVPDEAYQEKFGQIFSRYLGFTGSLEKTLDYCGDLFNSSSKRAFQGNL